MIQMSDIRKRQHYLKSNQYNSRKMNMNILAENAKVSKNVLIIENLFKDWKSLNVNEEFAFIECMSVVDQFCKNTTSSNVNKVLNIMIEEVIPSIKDLKHVKKNIQSIKESSIDYYQLLESVDKYLICDRVVNNQEKLNKLNFEKIIKESNTFGSDNLQLCIYELCSIINSLNIKFDVKYNLALENTLYSFDKLSSKYDKKFIMENVTDYFLFKKELEDNTVDIMNRIISENQYYEDVDKSNLLYLRESSENTIKGLINNFKIQKIKTPEGLKELIKKIYTKSSDQIIDDLPNLLSLIRGFIIGAVFGSQPIIGILLLIVDYFISMNLKRKETDVIIKTYKSEVTKIEKIIDKTKDDKKKNNLKEYKTTLGKNITKLEEYRDSLYTDKENDERFDAQFESGTLLDEMIAFENEKPITVKDYFSYYHSQVKSEIDKFIRNLYIISSKKYKKLIESGVINMVDDSEIKSFANINDSTIMDYLGADNKICIPIGYFLPLKYSDKITPEVNDKIFDILSDLCDTIQDTLNTDYCSLYDGNEDLYYMFLSFNIPINIEEEQVSESNIMHRELRKKVALLYVFEETINKLNESNIDSINNKIDSDCYKYDSEYINTLTECLSMTTNSFDLKSIANIFNESRELVSKDNPDRYKIKSSLNNSKYKLENCKVDNSYKSPYEVYNNLCITNEVVESINDYSEAIHESFGNTIKMTRERLKTSALRLSDKEKMASRQLDASLEKFQDKVTNELTNKNRERVIKGSILPSASGIIKLCLVSLAGFMIVPTLTVIGIIGGIAISKLATVRERQFILDEIEIQIKIVEKKIQLAENNNDMKSLEELMKIEKRLKREKQRIHYHMKNYYPVSARD